MNLPRYFIPRPLPPDEAAPSAGGVIEHVIDVFALEGTAFGTKEIWVGVDNAGHLSVDVSHGLSSRAQAQLSYHEVSGGRTRSLEVQSLFLFDLQLVEQAPDSPGANDPVFLYGVLYGPLPHESGGRVPALQGQLTVTRADILEGLVAGAPFAFQYQGTADVSSDASSTPVRPRCFHLALPASRQDEIELGQGIVIAYPLLSLDLFTTEPVNEIPVNQIAYDVLAGLWGDLSREQPRRHGAGKVLPPPDREAYVRQLQGEGYRVGGDTAVRKKSGLFGVFSDEKIDIPPEGNVDVYVQLASEALQSISGWPPPRTRALRARLRSAPSAPAFLRHPKDVRAAPPSKPSVAAPKPRASVAAPPAWMQDFVDTHHQPGRPAPHLTGATSQKVKAPTQTAASHVVPDWMKDFEP